jgi:hypothetical protein
MHTHPRLLLLLLLCAACSLAAAQSSWFPAWRRVKPTVSGKGAAPPPAPRKWQSPNNKKWSGGKGGGKGGKGGGGGGGKGGGGGGRGGKGGGRGGGRGAARSGASSTAIATRAVAAATPSAGTSTASSMLESMPIDARFAGLDQLLTEYVGYRERAEMNLRAIRKEIRALRRAVAKQQAVGAATGRGSRGGGAAAIAAAKNACVIIDSFAPSLPPAVVQMYLPSQTADESISKLHWRNALEHSPPPRTSIPKLVWLHMPKAGTSFMVTIIQYACPASMQRAYNNGKVWYPEDIYQHWLTKGYVSGAGCTFDWALRTRCDVSPRFTWHHTALPWDSASAKREGVNLSSVVTILRKPLPRLVSGFAYRLHGLAWSQYDKESVERRRLVEKMAPSPILFYALHTCGVQARLLAGATHMLDGKHVDVTDHKEELAPMACSSQRIEKGLEMLREIERLRNQGSAPAHSRGSPAEKVWSAYVQGALSLMRLDFTNPSGVARKIVDRAKERLDAAAFVGVTEHWRGSICTFHKMYGGEQTAPETRRMVDALSKRIWHRMGTHMSADRDSFSGTGRPFSSIWSQYLHKMGGDDSAASALGGANESTRGLLRSAKGAMMATAQRSLEEELEKLGFRDWMDEMVYKHAVSLFQGLAQKHGCSLELERKPKASLESASAAVAKWRSAVRGGGGGGGGPTFKTCQRGVRSEGSGVLCCPSECGSCDGNGCASRPGGPRHCCGLAIWKGGKQCMDGDDTSCIIGGASSRAYPAHAWGVCRMYYGFPHSQYVSVGKRRMFCPAAGSVDVGAKAEAKAKASKKAVVAVSSQTSLCAGGVRSLGGHGSVCCPKGCGTCDGFGCSLRPGGPTECCGNAIWRLGKACAAADVAGPCIIGGQWSQAFSSTTWGAGLHKKQHSGADGGAPEAGRTPDRSSKALVALAPALAAAGKAPLASAVIASAKCQKGARSESGNKIVCCPASCGQCDGNGCSSRPGGPRHCCGLAIWKGGRQCLGPEDTLCIIGGAQAKGGWPAATFGVCKGAYSYTHGQYVWSGVSSQRKYYCPGEGVKKAG